MAQENFGKQLNKLAKSHGYSAVRIASLTGATRCTVYNWFLGKGISPAYRAGVLKLIAKLQAKGIKK